ncbi:hypothetical protein BDV09DRAFT_192825 [Aspergillus tetrazonus]
MSRGWEGQRASLSGSPSPSSTGSVISNCSKETRSLVEQYAEALLERMENTEAMRLGRAFITYDSLCHVWEQSQSEILNNLDLTERDAIYVRNSLLRTFSILMVIRWDEWHRFSELFLRERDCETRFTDEVVMKLPPSNLKQYLGVSWALNFQNWIAAFDPIIIESGKIMACEKNVMSSSSGHSEYVPVPDGGRLPFLLKESGSQLGRGGYGTVTKETIAAGHLRDRDREPNLRNKVVARKCFTNKIYFDRERVIMSLLVKGLLKHDNIVYPLAMISLESEYSILMDVADCNLEAFLTEEGKMDSTISLKSLLKQVANLAHALESLHNPDASGYIIHHLDLTPKNVLVKRSNDTDNPWTWLLSDFGRSKHYFNRTTAESGANSVQTGPQVSSSERTSTYLPQEKKRGSFTDIWSLGCILCRVVCRKRHGIEGLQRFDELRFMGDEDGNDYFYRGTTVNPHVKSLLNQFCSSGCTVTKECGKLLKSVLSMNKNVRPKALMLYLDLNRIIETCEESTHTEISLEIESSRPQTPLNTGQSHAVPSQPVSEHTEPSTADVEPRGVPLIQINGDTDEGQEPENSVDRSSNPVFLAIENLREDDALVQIKSFFRGSIRGYANIGLYDKGLTPLCHAAKKGFTKVVKFLHDKGAQVDERDKSSNTPLMYACKKGHCDTAEYLIDQGADWNLQGEDGYTCLHFATEAKNIKIIDVLIKKQSRDRVKLDANKFSTLDRTPLELHINKGESADAYYELMEKLINLGANAKASSLNPNHKTAQYLAKNDGDQRALKILAPKLINREVPKKKKIRSVILG